MSRPIYRFLGEEPARKPSPKINDRLPSIPFLGAKMLVSGRVHRGESRWLATPQRWLFCNG